LGIWTAAPCLEKAAAFERPQRKDALRGAEAGVEAADRMSAAGTPNPPSPTNR